MRSALWVAIYRKLGVHSRHEALQVAEERHLILCNLAVRRRVFEAGIRFPVLFGGEENVLMGRADHQGFQLRYVPELWVHHRRRTTLRQYVCNSP